ncbi:hypothetical protein [Paenibacillus sp. 23TSA30-6]|uniref:hypothetical protein n=1 Tax=Paenibacillus sp. 23TSA30-6 TaxID=2546104 RepID=UPI00178862B5|nr:hypothetical protein [Paenibacillus sp. 23TSA30-6]
MKFSTLGVHSIDSSPQRATRKRANGERYYTLYYQCGQFANKGSAVCRANSIRADYVEPEILRRIQEFVNQPQLIEDVMNRLNGKQKVDKGALIDELKQIDKEISDLARKKSKYFKLYEEDMLEVHLLKERVGELAEQETVLLKQRVDIEDVLKNEGGNPVNLDQIRGMLGEFTGLFDQMSNERKKQLVHAIIKRVTVASDRKIREIQLIIH